MDTSQIKRNKVRISRARRVRKHLRGDQAKPRLSVVRSNQQVYVQLINDEKHQTLASTSTLSKEFKSTAYNKKNVESSKQLGLKIAQLAKDLSITHVVFDRGRYKYHGVIAAVADGAREGGLVF